MSHKTFWQASLDRRRQWLDGVISKLDLSPVHADTGEGDRFAIALNVAAQHYQRRQKQ